MLRIKFLTPTFAKLIMNIFLLGMILSLVLVLFPSQRIGSAAPSTLFKKLLHPSQIKKYSFPTLFAGNTYFSSKELLDAAEAELLLFNTDYRKKSAIDDAAYQMELAYHAVGFPDVAVEYFISEDKDIPDVQFLISEGHRVMVQKIFIQGNTTYDDAFLFALNKKLKTVRDSHNPFPFIFQQMKSFARSIAEFYIAEGFLDAKISQPQLMPGSTPDQTATVFIQINEGKKYIVGNMLFGRQELPESEMSLLETFDSLKGIPYNPRVKLLLKSKLMEYYQNKGFADVVINVASNKRQEKGVVDITITIKKGVKAIISEITIKGNNTTKELFIRKKIKPAIGEIYTLKDEKESFSALYQTGIFSSVDFKIEDLELPGNKKLLIDLVEKPTKEVFIETGWGSYELLRFTAGYSNNNYFGTGKNFRIESAASSKTLQISIGLTDPQFLDFPITADIPINFSYRQEPEYTIKENGLAIFFSQKFSNKTRISTGYSYREKSITDLATTLDPLYRDNNYNNASLTMSFSQDTRDDFFLPKAGHRGLFSMEYAGAILGGDLAYMRFTGGFRVFKQISEGNVLALRYKTGVILPGYGQDGIPIDERFFNGGESSVRSFRESRLGPKDGSGASLGGTGFNTLSIELRRMFSSQLAGTAFIDAGNISPNQTTVNGISSLAAERNDLISATRKDFFRDFRYGVGCGIQYLLPIGPARIDFSYNPDRRSDSESQYALHLSIGMAF